MTNEMAIATVETLLRTPRLGDDRRRLALDPVREGAPHSGPVPVVPGRLDEPAPGGAVAGLVSAPRRCASPEEYSLGTRPR